MSSRTGPRDKGDKSDTQFVIFNVCYIHLNVLRLVRKVPTKNTEGTKYQLCGDDNKLCVRVSKALDRRTAFLLQCNPIANCSSGAV